MSNYKTVFFTLGILQIILGLFMIFPIIIQFTFNELDSSFISAGIICVIFGMLFFFSNLDHDKKLFLPHTFLLTALSWISIAIFGSLPFIFSNLDLSFTDSFFESMSGITTTGSTVITNLNEAPKAILFWRAILQWLGGIGIIVMAITLMPIMNVGGMQLLKISDVHTGEKILPKSKEIIIRLIIIYLFLTITCAFFYKIFGMGYFDSLTHSMTIKTFIKIIIFSILLLFLYLIIKKGSFVEISLRSVYFNVISILTGTGYVTKDFDQWGNFPLVLFLILMFIGGCAGSTACGIKIFRVQLLYFFVINQLKKAIYPKGVFVIKYGKNNINDKFMASVISFIYLYIIIFFILTSILSLTGLDFITAISGAATSISNVGPGLGEIIGPNGNFSTLSNPSKWALSAGMILGRLELFAILVLFIPSFWRKF